MAHIYELCGENVITRYIRNIEAARIEARRLANLTGVRITVFKCTIKHAIRPKDLLLAALNRSGWASERVALETYRPRNGGDRGTVPMAAFRAVAAGDLGQFPGPDNDPDFAEIEEDDGTSGLADEERET